MFIAPLPPNSGLVVLTTTLEVGAPVLTCAVGVADAPIGAGKLVGRALGPAVGAREGAGEGPLLGCLLGALVGARDGEVVGALLGAFVGAVVGGKHVSAVPQPPTAAPDHISSYRHPAGSSWGQQRNWLNALAPVNMDAMLITLPVPPAAGWPGCTSSCRRRGTTCP
jgi:hypothetical protein